MSSNLREKRKELPPRKLPPCRNPEINLEFSDPGKPPREYNSFPRDCRFAYMTPVHYATGFRILDVYRGEPDFSEFRDFYFLEDPKQQSKWCTLRSRIPYPEGRITDLPGTRDFHYQNYYLREFMPESAMSWRDSITKLPGKTIFETLTENEANEKCVP